MGFYQKSLKITARDYDVLLYVCDECGERHFVPGPCAICGSDTSDLEDADAFTQKLADLGAYGCSWLEGVERRE